MLKTTDTFKNKMKVYGKQLNILLGFGQTKLNKTHVKKLDLSVNGDLFTSVMRQIDLEIENYTTIDKSKIMTVKEVHEANVRKVNKTQVKYLAEDQDKEYTVDEINKTCVKNVDNARLKFIIPHAKRENIENASVINIQLGVRTSEFDDYEYIDWGEFVVYDKEEKIDTGSLKLYLYDHMIDSHIKYVDSPLSLDYSKEDVTVLDLLRAICNKFGWILKTTDFANANKIISEDKYTELTDFTYRDILDEIAAVAGGFIKIINKDLYVAYPTDTGETIDENDLEKLTIGKKIGAYNTIVLGRSPQEDNIYYPSASPASGRISIRIDNNQIMDRNRSDFIEEIYNHINGLSYYVFDYKSFGFGYYEFGDIVTLKDLHENEYKTILFNITVEITSGIKEKANTKEPKYSETKYQYATSIEKRITNTEIITNKQEGKIQEIIEEQIGASSRMNLLESTINETKRTISDYQSETDNKMAEFKESLDGLNINLKNNSGNNIFYYATDFWNGDAIESYINTDTKKNTISGMGYKLSIGTASQDTMVKNDIYTISFLYKNTNKLDNTTVMINGISEKLDYTGLEWKEYTKQIKVTDNRIVVSFKTDTNDAIELADVMENIGAEKQAWSQNPNETHTDTVDIGKGIQVNSSTSNTYTRMDADGFRSFNSSTGEVTTELTDKGTVTKELQVKTKAEITGLLFQEIESQSWISKL